MRRGVLRRGFKELGGQGEEVLRAVRRAERAQKVKGRGILKGREGCWEEESGESRRGAG